MFIVCLFHKSNPQEIHFSGSGGPGIYMQEKDNELYFIFKGAKAIYYLPRRGRKTIA
jgi:hypothetical protein